MALARIGHPAIPPPAARLRETPLVDAPKLAGAWRREGLRKGRIEPPRLPAFKVLGASWAYTGPWRSVLGRISGIGGDLGAQGSVSNPCGRSRSWRPPTATTGAPWHGWRGYWDSGRRSSCQTTWSPARRKSIAEEGAEVIVVDGTYDEAVERSAAEAAGERAPGLGHVLAWLRAYTSLGDRRLFDDAVGDRRRAGEEERRRTRPRGRAGRRRRLRRRRGPPLPLSRSFATPKLMSVEPASADCLLESVEGEHRVRAWAARFHHVGSKLRQALAGRLADRIQASTSSSPSTTTSPRGHAPWRPNRASCQERPGRPGLGGLLELLRRGRRKTRRAWHWGETRVLLFNCEGATDPDAYRRIMAVSILSVRGGFEPALQLTPPRDDRPFTRLRLPFAVSKVAASLAFCLEPSAVCGRSRARMRVESADCSPPSPRMRTGRGALCMSFSPTSTLRRASS